MKVNVKCFATLVKDQVCDYKGSMQYEMPEKSKVSDLIAKLGLPLEEIHIIFLNHIIVGPGAELHDGDNIGLAPVTGGM
jgi:molybdopterin synthase sulfur carrier subunit